MVQDKQASDAELIAALRDAGKSIKDVLEYPGIAQGALNEASDRLEELTRAPATVTHKGDELLPCPFCGVQPITKEWIVVDTPQIKIICDGDMCHVHPSVFGNRETMVKVWNTRAQQPAAADVEALASNIWAYIFNSDDETVIRQQNVEEILRQALAAKD